MRASKLGVSVRLVPAALALLLAATETGAQAPAGGASPVGGSLTLLSRPAGASFRLLGDQVVVGRTPTTIDRALTGRYRIRSQEPGYEPWRRSVILDGASSDTVWMSLRAKSSALAAVRSLIVPGWGQLYGDHPSRALTWLALVGGSGAVLSVAALEYRDRLDRYRTADDRYRAATTVDDLAVTYAERRHAADEAESAYKIRQIALGVTGSLWAISMIDAVVTFPALRPIGLAAAPASAPLRLSLEPAPESPGWRAALRATF